MFRPALPITAVALALLGGAPAAHAIQDQPAPAEAPATPAGAFAGRDLIVQWAPGADRGDRVDAREDAEVDFTTNLGDRDFQLVTVEPGQSVHDAVASLAADPAVAVAERDSSSAPAAIPNDPLLGQLWGLENLGSGVDGFSGAVAGDDISAIAAWDRTIGLPSVVVADVDSGYRFEHPDLANVAWNNPEEVANGKDDDENGIVDDLHGADFVGDDGENPEVDGDPTDSDLLSGGHGVHTAGIIGAQGNNGIGISGVARNIRLMPLRVCSRFPSLEDSRCPISSQISAINYAAAKGARVVNMSLTSNFPSQVEVNAIAEHPELLFVIAAGNDGGDNDGGGTAPQGHHYPCDYQPQLDASPPVIGAVDNVVCVAATDQADELAGFSDWGATSVDLGAPGTEILSTYPFPSPLDDRFGDEAAFAGDWPASGADGGFERSNEAPLTSFGMTDRIGEPSASQIRETTSAPVTVPPNSGCQLNQTRHVSLAGGDSYRYSVLLDGAEVKQASSEPGSSAGPGLERRFLPLPDAFKAGGTVQVRFRFTSGPTPTPESGVWLDDVSIACVQAVGLASGYGFLQGTSMAAPQVSGAAALLFSLKPTATVSEAREALLLGVDPILSLEGRTTSGGRLDVAAALEALVPIGSESVPPQTAITAGPSGTTASEEAEFEFTRTDADAGSFECRLDGEPFAPCTSPVSEIVEDGKHVFAVRSKIESTGLVDPSPAERLWTVSATPPEEDEPEPEPEPEPKLPVDEKPPVTTPATPNVVQTPPAETPVVVPQPAGCTVPKLAGLGLKRAQAALTGAGCTPGSVKRPRQRPGRHLVALVVKFSSPRSGAHSASGKVNLVLAAKPSATGSHR